MCASTIQQHQRAAHTGVCCKLKRLPLPIRHRNRLKRLHCACIRLLLQRCNTSGSAASLLLCTGPAARNPHAMLATRSCAAIGWPANNALGLTQAQDPATARARAPLQPSARASS